jgi:hypothetical protein
MPRRVQLSLDVPAENPELQKKNFLSCQMTEEPFVAMLNGRILVTGKHPIHLRSFRC